MSTEDRVKDVEGLTDSIVLILSNLDKLPNKDSLDDILQLIDYSPVSNYKAIFEDVKKFYNDNGRYPEPEYLESKYTHKYYKVEQGFSYDVLIDFVNQLRKHKKLKELNKALVDLDLDKISEIVNKDVKIRSQGHEVTIDNIFDIYEVMEQQPHGMMLGIPELDFYTKGLDYGTLNVISAPVSTFKTTLAISTAYHACFNEGKNIIYLTLEVTPSKVMLDLLARHAYEMGTPLKAGSLKKATLPESEKETFRKVVEDWKKNCKGNIRIIGTSDIEEYTTTYLEMYINKKREEMGGLDMLYIDYLNLFKNKVPPSLKLDQYQSLNYYTQFFTDLSIRFNFILMMLCQISRAGTDKLDSQANKEGGKKLASTTFFAEANEVERSASVAFILHATRAMKNRNNVDVFLVKNRDGACPEEPITTVVVPEYFVVGTKDFSNLNSQDGMVDNCLTNSDYSMDNLEGLDISGLSDSEVENINLDD